MILHRGKGVRILGSAQIIGTRRKYIYIGIHKEILRILKLIDWQNFC